jgi:Protein of unknown function (DUF732)
LAMRFLLMLAALAATIGLAVPAHADSTDDQFLAALGPAGINFADPAKAIAAGKSVCTMANGGAGGPLPAPPASSNMRMVNIVMAIHSSNPGLNWTKAADFTRIADNAYCPDVPTDDLATLDWNAMSQGGTY